MIKSAVISKLPADISYFDNNKLDEVFAKVEEAGGKSEDYAYVLSSLVVNIGNAARQPSSLNACYKRGIRYKGQVLEYFEKYKDKLSVTGKKKLRHSIESQFKHSQINLVKSILTGVKIKGVPLASIPFLVTGLDPKKTLGGSTMAALIQLFIDWNAIKFYDLLEAVRVYKMAMNNEFDIDDPKAMYYIQAVKKNAWYFYDVAFRVLQDMMKVYDQL